jgi:hypothetical protein
VHGLSCEAAGNSHRELGLVAVFMLSRSLIQVSRSWAKGRGPVPETLRHRGRVHQEGT